MSRLNRPVVALMATLLAASLACFSLPQAQADRVSDARDKLTELQGEASAADEQYNQVNAQLAAAQAKLDQDRQAIQDQQAKVDSLRQQIAIISLQQFQDRGITSTAVLLASDDQDEAINSFVVSAMVTDTTNALLQNYELSQATLADMERSQQNTVDSISADQARLEDLKNQADQKVDEAQSLLDRLTEQQRAQIDAANAADMVQADAGASPSYSPPPPVQNGAAAAAIVDWAMARVGLPYVYGGAGPNSYDCSGFTMAAYATVGIKLPHGSSTQFHYGKPVAVKDLQPGDLVFYYSGPGHVEIYVGGGMTVGARNARLGVVYRSINSGMPIVGARRLL